MENENLNNPVERGILGYKTAPHEPAAILRAFRQGMVGPGLAKAMSMQPKQAVESLRIAMEETDTAERQGRPIHTDPQVRSFLVKVGEVKTGDKLLDDGREINYAGSPYNNQVILHLVGGGQLTFPQHHQILIIRKLPKT